MHKCPHVSSQQSFIYAFQKPLLLLEASVWFIGPFKSHRWNSKVSQDPWGTKAANTLEIIWPNSLSPWFMQENWGSKRGSKFSKVTLWARCRVETKPEASRLPDEGFSILTLLTFGVRSFRGCHVHCWKFSSVPALCPLHAIANTPTH